MDAINELSSISDESLDDSNRCDLSDKKSHKRKRSKSKKSKDKKRRHHEDSELEYQSYKVSRRKESSERPSRHRRRHHSSASSGHSSNESDGSNRRHRTNKRAKKRHRHRTSEERRARTARHERRKHRSASSSPDTLSRPPKTEPNADQPADRSVEPSRWDEDSSRHGAVKTEPPSGAESDERPNDGGRRHRERRGETARGTNRDNGNTQNGTGEVWGRPEDQVKKEEAEPVEKDKPNLGLSGKLTEDANTYKGVVIKYSQPTEARKPKRRWRWYIFKGDEELPFLPLHRQSAYLIGRERRVVDVPTDHPSCSKQHAVLQYRLVRYTKEDGKTGRTVKPYIIDLDSANGTYVNNRRITARSYVELLEKDVVKFGYSSREYVLLHETSKDSDVDTADGGLDMSPVSALMGAGMGR